MLQSLVAAARATRRLQGHVGSRSKDDGSPVTVADLASQALILAILGDAFPADRVLAEESFPTDDDGTIARVLEQVRFVRPGATERHLARWIDFGRTASRSDRWWLIDPIDGTQGFLAGEQYAVAIALIEDGIPVLAGVACPRLGSDGAGLVYWSEGKRVLRADESLADPVAVRASKREVPARCRILESRHLPHSDQDRQARVREALGVKAEPRRLDGMAKYALIASGEAEIYLRLPRPEATDRAECAWDHASGALLVGSAGGTVTDAKGRALDFSAGAKLPGCWGIVATNGRVHDAVLAAIA